MNKQHTGDQTHITHTQGGRGREVDKREKEAECEEGSAGRAAPKLSKREKFMRELSDRGARTVSQRRQDEKRERKREKRERGGRQQGSAGRER